ncbi:hypothetical protein [Polycladospora coralii]|nr:hypothetical protein [Polycladospora coralii]
MVHNQIPIEKKKGGRVRLEEKLKMKLHMDDTAFKEHLLHLRFFQMLTFKQLGDIFNCSASSAQVIYKRYGIETKQRYNLLSEMRLYDLYVKQNKTILECGAELGCSHTLVRYYLVKYKIPLRSAGAKRIEDLLKAKWNMTDYQLKKYLIELTTTHTVKELSEQMGHSKSSIRRMYKRLDIATSWR